VGPVLPAVTELHEVRGVLGLTVPVGVADAPEALPVDVGVERIKGPEQALGPGHLRGELLGDGHADAIDRRGRDPVDPLPPLIAGEQAPSIITGEAYPRPHLVPRNGEEKLRLEAIRQVEVGGRHRRLADLRGASVPRRPSTFLAPSALNRSALNRSPLSRGGRQEQGEAK